MTKKVSTKSKKRGADDAVMEVTVIMPTPHDLPFYYVNHLEVSQSPFEFAIAGGRAPARMTDAQRIDVEKNKKLAIEPVVQILIPAAIMPGFIKALQTQLEKHESNYGKSGHPR